MTSAWSYTDTEREQLRRHMFHRHALDNALRLPSFGPGYLTDDEIYEMHEDEHHGPGTIRNHECDDWSYVEREPKYMPPDETAYCPHCSTMMNYPKSGSADERYCPSCERIITVAEAARHIADGISRAFSDFRERTAGEYDEDDEDPEEIRRLYNEAPTGGITAPPPELRLKYQTPESSWAMVTYDPAVKALYVDLRPLTEDQSRPMHHKTVSLLNGNLMIDLDRRGMAIGVEVLGVEPADPQEIQPEGPRPIEDHELPEPED